MKLFKKVAILALSLGMVGSLAACGGGGGGADNGNAKGAQVTKEEWTTVMTNAYNADNVTISMNLSGYSEENDLVWTGLGTGTVKIADGKLHEQYAYKETYNGDSETYTDQTYIAKVDGTYYEWYKDSIDTLDWVSRVCDEAESNPTYLTAGKYVLSDFMGTGSLESYIMIYDYMTFDSATGEYKWVEGDHAGESYTLAIKVLDGKLYTVRERMELGTAYEEMKCVFSNFGTTTVSTMFGVDEDEGTSDSSQGGSIGGEVGGDDSYQQVDAAGWAAAIAATRAATNFSATVTMEAYALGSGMTGPAATGLATMSIADNKGYVEMTTTMAGMGSFTHYSYCGNVDGKNYSWESDDGDTWYCEQQGDAIDIDGDWMVSELFCDEMTFETATFDAETGIYSYTTADGVTYSIGFANGKVVYHSYSYTEDMGSVMETTETYVITYGNATVGQLPPVTAA